MADNATRQAGCYPYAGGYWWIWIIIIVLFFLFFFFGRGFGPY